MKQTLFLAIGIVIFFTANSQNKQQQNVYTIPDSIKTIGYITDIIISNDSKVKKLTTGINADDKIYIGVFKSDKKYLECRFYKGKRILIPYNWKSNETYKLLVLTAADSALDKTIYTGYIYLPALGKWKLIGTKIFNDTLSIKQIKTEPIDVDEATAFYSNRWILRSNNTWKALDSANTKPPALRPMRNIDSLEQQNIEVNKIIAKLPKEGLTYKDGIFFKIIKESNGNFVQLTDTVTIHYKGWLLSNGSIFDQTKEKPATFPLSRLIRGWQIGVPQCKTGGTIRIYIPSGSAYGIRTFATDIPPNNTLVFDVEILEAKAKIEEAIK